MMFSSHSARTSPVFTNSKCVTTQRSFVCYSLKVRLIVAKIEKIYSVFVFPIGFHFEAEEFSELIVGNDSLVDYVRNFTEIWYSNYSLTMCMDDLLAARERAHDPYKLGRFCDEMEAFRLYTGRVPSSSLIESLFNEDLFPCRSGSDDPCLHSQFTSIHCEYAEVG